MITLPNHTQVSNEFIDKGMSQLKGNAVKVLLAVYRKTIGWHKLSDKIAYSQLQKMTGIKHNVTLKSAIDELIEKEYITREKVDDYGYRYDLNILVSKTDTSSPDLISENDTSKGKLISETDTTKEKNIKKEYKESDIMPLEEVKYDNLWNKSKTIKRKHLDFVSLTTEEFDKLTTDYGQATVQDFIERLNDYIGSKGKKYKSHYFTIKNWMRRDGVQKKEPVKKMTAEQKTAARHFTPREE